jgi:23S rRNA pseudouridine1911/1915/1917 synthase
LVLRPPISGIMVHLPLTNTDPWGPLEPHPEPEQSAVRDDPGAIDSADSPDAPLVVPPISILFEDAHCLAVVKPPGQLTQGTWAPPGELSLETAVRRYLNPSDPRAVYLGMVHRLDRPTSGVLLWAKTAKAAHRLSSQFERRRVVKEYWAIVEMNLLTTEAEPGLTKRSVPVRVPYEGIWTDWLTRADESGVVSVVAPHTSGAREAVTKVNRGTAVALPPGCAWLRLWPQTGRTHQLRAQTTRRGMPILGDSTYGATVRSPLSPGIALHARLLTVRHPILNNELNLVAPLPSTWATAGIVLADLGERNC